MAKDKRVKMTLLLDSDTISILSEYSYNKHGRTNISNAVREIAKEYGNIQQNRQQQQTNSLEKVTK